MLKLYKAEPAEQILLTAINARFTHSNLANFYFKNSLENNYKVIIQEFSINEKLEDIIQKIVSSKSKIISFSIYIWNTELHKKIIPQIKKILPIVKIIIGGPEATFNCDYWYENFPSIDLIVRGSGEEAFKNLDLSKRKITDFLVTSQLPELPYKAKDFQYLENKYIYYEASRGCPYFCTYCLSSRNDQKLIFKDIEEVKNDIDKFIKYEVKIVKFVDRTFNVVRKFSQEIWEYLILKNTKTKFHFEINPQLLDKTDFEILKNVKNNFQFEIGIQSINNETQKLIKRNIFWEKIQPQIKRLISETNIHIHLDQIVGLPNENYEMIKESFDAIIKLNPDHFQMGFLKILSGTEMFYDRKKYEMSYFSFPPYEILSNKFLNYQEISKLKLISEITEMLFNSGKFNMTLNSLIPTLRENNFRENNKDKKKSPFLILEEIATFYEKNKFSTHTAWINSAKHIIAFSQNSEDVKFALRYDWFKMTQTNYFPDFLGENVDAILKKRIRKFLRLQLKEKKLPFLSSSSEINKAVYFRNFDGSIFVKFLMGKKEKVINLIKDFDRHEIKNI